MNTVGELPARKSVAEKDANKNHAKYGPFIRGLNYSYATDFVNESAQRKVLIDMVDTITLKNVPTKDAVARPLPKNRSCLTPSTRSRARLRFGATRAKSPRRTDPPENLLRSTP